MTYGVVYKVTRGDYGYGLTTDLDDAVMCCANRAGYPTDIFDIKGYNEDFDLVLEFTWSAINGLTEVEEVLDEPLDSDNPMEFPEEDIFGDIEELEI